MKMKTQDESILMSHLELTVLTGLIDLAVSELIELLNLKNEFKQQCKYRVGEVSRVSGKINDKIVKYLDKFGENAAVNHGLHALSIIEVLKQNYSGELNSNFWSKLIYLVTENILSKSKLVKNSNFEYPFDFEIKSIKRNITIQFNNLTEKCELNELYSKLDLGIKIVKENENE